MSPVPDDYEQLRRLLALKRHEQPPPGYFNGFSRQVIVLIKAGELGNDSATSFWSFGAGSFFQRIWATLDTRPVFAGAFGVAVCGFFVAGALLSDNGTAREYRSENGIPPTPPVTEAQVWQHNNDAEFSSTVGVAMPNYQPASSLFQEIRSLQQGAKAQQVDFRVPANFR